MNPYSLPALAVLIVSISLGIFILRKDPRDKFNRSFFLFALAVSVWVLGKFMKRSDINLFFLDTWIIVEMVGAILVPSLMLYFVSRLQPATNPRLLKSSYFWLTIYGISLFFFFLLFSGRLIGDVVQGDFGHEYAVEKAYFLFGAYYLILLFIATARLFSIFKISKLQDATREQSKLLFLGLLIAIMFTGLNDVIFPILDIDVMPLTGIGLFLFELFIAYAIAKHKLLVIPQIRRFFTPSPEAFLRTKIKHKVESGYNYLFREKVPNHSADMFIDQVTHGQLGLWITSPHQKSPSGIGISKTPVLFLTPEIAPGVASHPIDKLNSLVTLVENELLLAGGKMLVMLDCFEDIVLINAFKQSLNFVNKLSQTCSRNSSSLIVRIDANKFSKKQLDLLEKSLHPVRVDVQSNMSR